MSKRQPRKAPAPGVYREIPAAVYHEWDAMNASTLGLGRADAGGMAALRHYLDSKPDAPSREQMFGTAFHTVALELAARVVEVPGLKPNSGPARWHEEQARRPGMEVVAEGDIDRIESMMNGVVDNPASRELIEAMTDRELSIVWEDPATGVLCKMRADGVVPRGDYPAMPPILRGILAQHPAIVDVKTTRKVGTEAFENEVRAWQYHAQAGMYQKGYQVGVGGSETSPVPAHLLLACCKEPPHSATVYMLEWEWVAIGRKMIEGLLAEYAGAWLDDRWKGAAEDVVVLVPKPWDRKGFDEVG